MKVTQSLGKNMFIRFMDRMLCYKCGGLFIGHRMNSSIRKEREKSSASRDSRFVNCLKFVNIKIFDAYLVNC